MGSLEGEGPDGRRGRPHRHPLRRAPMLDGLRRNSRSASPYAALDGDPNTAWISRRALSPSASTASTCAFDARATSDHVRPDALRRRARPPDRIRWSTGATSGAPGLEPTKAGDHNPRETPRRLIRTSAGARGAEGGAGGSAQLRIRACRVSRPCGRPCSTSARSRAHGRLRRQAHYTVRTARRRNRPGRAPSSADRQRGLVRRTAGRRARGGLDAREYRRPPPGPGRPSLAVRRARDARSTIDRGSAPAGGSFEGSSAFEGCAKPRVIGGRREPARAWIAAGRAGTAPGGWTLAQAAHAAVSMQASCGRERVGFPTRGE